MSILNFNKNLIITGFTEIANESVYFNKVNSNISIEPFYKIFKNIYGNQLSKIKGYDANANVKIFIINNPLETEKITLGKINKIIKMLENISITHPITLTFRKADNVTIAKEFLFHELASQLDYTDFFNNNSNLGLSFDFQLKTSLLLSYSDIPESWTQ